MGKLPSSTPPPILTVHTKFVSFLVTKSIWLCTFVAVLKNDTFRIGLPTFSDFKKTHHFYPSFGKCSVIQLFRYIFDTSVVSNCFNSWRILGIFFQILRFWGMGVLHFQNNLQSKSLSMGQTMCYYEKNLTNQPSFQPTYQVHWFTISYLLAYG